MENMVDVIPRGRVIELFDAIEAVLHPFKRAELRGRFQEVLWQHNNDQGAENLYVERVPFAQLYDDVAAAIDEIPARPEDHDDSFAETTSYDDRIKELQEERGRLMREQQQKQQQQQRQKPVFGPEPPPPRQPRPLLAPDSTIRNANIWYNGGGGGTTNANLSQRSLEDARIQMQNVQRTWQSIGRGTSKRWNQLKAKSGVAANKNNNNNNNNNNVIDPFSPPPYTPATRRTTARPSRTPPARLSARDARIAKRRAPGSRPQPPTGGAASSPLRQNMHQLSNYVRSQGAEYRRSNKPPPPFMERTLKDIDNKIAFETVKKLNAEKRKRGVGAL